MQEQEIKVKKQSGVSKALDKIFHFTERGGTMGSEIGAGFGAFLISVCALVMNTQIIGAAYGNYAGSYLAVALMCFVGTLLLGILCNLPLVQTANMGLSSVLITIIGEDTGLTYANLMAVTFVAAVIYLIIVLTPAKQFLVDALPDGVKKALPVGVGIYVASTALRNTGLVDSTGALVTGANRIRLDQFYFWIMIAATILYFVFRAAKRKKPATGLFGLMIAAMWVGGILLYMETFIGGQTATTLVYERLNLVHATDGASPYNIALGISSLKIGELFASGFDFSAYTGSVPLLFVQGVLTFLFLGLYTNLGNTRAAAVVGEYENEEYAEKAEGKVLVAGAIMNVVAPILGASPTTVGAQSSVATHDRAKSGLASVSAAVGFLIAIFSWIFIMFIATGTNGVGMWIDDSETKLVAYVKDTCVFADLVMVWVGANMLKGIKNVDMSRLIEALPFGATVIGAGLVGNIAVGVALGVIAWVLTAALDKDERSKLTVPAIVLGVVMLVFLILYLL